MRYYIVDDNGNVYGDSDSMTGAELMLADTITELGYEPIGIEIIQGV